ncbi:MAG: hypothetical protein P4L63_00065 [Candidatus Pacebacteria bacterium]|nr:hypothetical protein [Candidatus Paceibacterota bacterium]
MQKTLEQFIGGKTWNMVLVILRKKRCSVVLAESNLGRVFLEENGFIWERNISSCSTPIRIALKTPSRVFGAISECRDSSAPAENEIVKFVVGGVLEKLANKS